MRLRERCIDIAFVSQNPVVTEIVRRVVVHLRRLHGVRHFDIGFQHLEVHIHQLGSVPRLRSSLRDHDGNVVSDVPRLVRSQRVVRHRLVWLAMAVRDHPAARDRTPVVRRHVGAREYIDHTRCGQRGVLVDSLHPRVGVWRTHEDGPQFTRSMNVIDVSALPREETTIFLPPDRPSDQPRRQFRIHRSTSSHRKQRTARP